MLEVSTIEAQGDNYIRYHDGIQICWGYISNDGNTGLKTLNFDNNQLFANDQYALVISAKRTSASTVNTAIRELGYVERMPTGFTYYTSGRKDYDVGRIWIAIGRWK